MKKKLEELTEDELAVYVEAIGIFKQGISYANYKSEGLKTMIMHQFGMHNALSYRHFKRYPEGHHLRDMLWDCKPYQKIYK